MAEFVARIVVVGRYFDLFERDTAVGRAEGVGRAQLRAAGVVVADGSDHHGVAADGHGRTELVAGRGVGGHELGVCVIRCGRVPAVWCGEVVGGFAAGGADHDPIAVDGHGPAEARLAVGGRQRDRIIVVGAAEDVGGFLKVGPDDDDALEYGDRGAELVVRRGGGGRQRLHEV